MLSVVGEKIVVIIMASRLGPIKRETIEHLRGCNKGKEKKSRNEQLEEASERLQELMPELWRRAALLSRLVRGSYEDLEDGFRVGFYPGDDDRIVLPVGSFMKKVKKVKETIQPEEDKEDKFIRSPIVVLYAVGEVMYQEDGSRGDRYLRQTRLVGETGCYDTYLAVQTAQEDGEGYDNWQFRKGIGLKRQKRALGAIAAMRTRVDDAIVDCLIENAAHEPRPEEMAPRVSIEDLLGNTEMVRLPEGWFAPAESGHHTGSSCNRRYPIALYSRPLEDFTGWDYDD